jgi:uncharacterized protein
MVTDARTYRNAACYIGVVKFHLSVGEGNVITGVGPGWIRIGVREYRENVVMTSETIAAGWAPGGFEALQTADFDSIVALAPEIVLLGTGRTQQFPHPRLMRSLTDAHIGAEVMDTPAACRTFNILAAEGRKVAAALLLE